MQNPLNIKKPTLLLDKSKALKNIKTMHTKAKASGVQLRPHFKTHQSAEVGAWFRHVGLKAITVSSVDMALYFAQHGWQDITIAFPVNYLQSESLNKLASQITLNLLLESVESTQGLAQKLQANVNIYLKIDVGYGRTGIAWDDFETLKTVALAVQQKKQFNLVGLLTHAGHSYQARSKAEVLKIYQNSLKHMQAAQKSLQAIGLPLAISIGDTPTCSVVDRFEGVDEIRPGNFVFFDLAQHQIGVCQEDEIAVVVACPVVAKHKKRQQVIIYGGAIHFSKDYILDVAFHPPPLNPQGGGSFNDPSLGGILNEVEGGLRGAESKQAIYGRVVQLQATPQQGWSAIVSNAFVTSLSQEHGVLQVDKKLFEQVRIGDIVTVLPIHSCLTANLLRRYLTLNGEMIEMMPFI